MLEERRDKAFITNIKKVGGVAYIKEYIFVKATRSIGIMVLIFFCMKENEKLIILFVVWIV